MNRTGQILSNNIQMPQYCNMQNPIPQSATCSWIIIFVDSGTTFQSTNQI